MISLALHQDTAQPQLETLSKRLDTAEKKINEYAQLIASLYAEVKRHQDVICHSCKEKVFRASLVISSPETRTEFTQSAQPTTLGTEATADPLPVVSSSVIYDLTGISQSDRTDTNSPSQQPSPSISETAPNPRLIQSTQGHSDWSVEYNSEISQSLSLYVANTFTFSGRVFCAKFSRDGKYLAVGLENGETHIYDMMAGSKSILAERSTTVFYAEAQETSSDIWTVQFGPDNKFLATGGSEGQINIWDIIQRRLRVTFKHADLVRSIDISPDSRFLVSASYDGSVCMWNIRDGSRRLLDGFVRPLTVKFSPDGQYIAVGNDRDSLGIWRTRDGRLLANYRIGGSGVRSVIFTPDGKQIASGGNTVNLWDASSLMDLQSGHMINDDTMRELNQIWEFNRHEDLITSVSFSFDNRWVVSSSYDHNVYILDAQSGEWVCTMKGHLQRVWAADFSPTGRYLITGGRDHLLRVWKYEVVE